MLGGLIALEVGLHVAIALQSPNEARTPKDERERLIELKATRVAFFVLLAGGLATMLVMHLHFRERAFLMGHCVLFTLFAAGVAKFGGQIVQYRRDA